MRSDSGDVKSMSLIVLEIQVFTNFRSMPSQETSMSRSAQENQRPPIPWLTLPDMGLENRSHQAGIPLFIPRLPQFDSLHPNVKFLAYRHRLGFLHTPAPCLQAYRIWTAGATRPLICARQSCPSVFSASPWIAPADNPSKACGAA